MKRAPRYHAITTIHSPPDWWALAWVEHQLDIRRRVKAILRSRQRISQRVGRDAVEQTALWFFLRLSRYEAREIEAALDGMVGDGVIDRNGACYSLSHHHECPFPDVV